MNNDQRLASFYIADLWKWHVLLIFIVDISFLPSSFIEHISHFSFVFFRLMNNTDIENKYTSLIMFLYEFF